MAPESAAYARASTLVGTDGHGAWVFDIDETLLSNFPYYVQHGYRRSSPPYVCVRRSLIPTSTLHTTTVNKHKSDEGEQK